MTSNGELIDLVWPDGNDEGELFIQGHVPVEIARQQTLDDSEELVRFAENAVLEDDLTALADDNRDERVQAMAAQLVGKAHVDHLYAYWHDDHDHEMERVIRTTQNPGPGCFEVTRLRLWPTEHFEANHDESS